MEGKRNEKNELLSGFSNEERQVVRQCLREWLLKDSEGQGLVVHFLGQEKDKGEELQQQEQQQEESTEQQQHEEKQQGTIDQQQQSHLTSVEKYKENQQQEEVASAAAAADTAVTQVEQLYLSVFAWLLQLVDQRKMKRSTAEQGGQNDQHPTAAAGVSRDPTDAKAAAAAAASVFEPERQQATSAPAARESRNGIAATTNSQQSKEEAAQSATEKSPAAAAASTRARPLLVVGISGPQGSGKTSLSHALSYLLLRVAGLRSIALSIDDFYLVHSRMVKLSKKYQENPLYQQRGNPGSHEVPLALCVLEALKQQQQRKEPVLVPVFDKAAEGGQGDRACVTDWRSVDPTAVDIVLLEGWLLGFQALPEANATYMPALSAEELKWMEPLNKALREYAPLNALVDAWIVLQVDNLDEIYVWRAEQERTLRKQRGEGMTEAQVHAFVRTFMPSYKAYLPGLYAGSPAGATQGTSTLRVDLGRDRAPIHFQSAGGENKRTESQSIKDARHLQIALDLSAQQPLSAPDKLTVSE